MSAPVRVLLVGAAGRMGQAIVQAAQSSDAIEIAAQLDLGNEIGSSIDGLRCGDRFQPSRCGGGCLRGLCGGAAKRS